MKMMKQMACAALAAALAAGISGCDSKSAKDYSSPKVAEGAILALAGRSAEDTSLAPILKKYKLDSGLASEENLKQMPAEMKDLVKELELDKAEFKWTALTVGDMSGAMKGDVPEVAVALATTLNLDKAVAACEKKLKEEKDEGKPEFKKEMVADVSAYSINSKDLKVGEKAVVPFVASLDGQLILAASSKAVLEKQIALYRDGKGASADFGSFALGANDMLRIKLAKVGENVKKSIPDPAMLQELNGFVPDADKLVLGLGAVELALSASADGKDAKLDLAVETASDADADKLRTLAKSGLMPLTAMVKGSKDDGMKLAAGVLQAAKIAGEGKVANLSVAYSADDLIKFVSEQKKNALK